MELIEKESYQELRKFLVNFPKPSIRTASTMIKGYVSCIKPIKTICGAEVMCHPDTADSVRQLILK